MTPVPPPPVGELARIGRDLRMKSNMALNENLKLFLYLDCLQIV